jgi:hypothetical protein
MIMKTGVALGLFALVLSLLVSGVSYADNAKVLPKGVSRVRVDGRYYLPMDERYDPDGDVEPLGADLNATLDSVVFSDLAMVESAFGLPSGFANVGGSVVSFEFRSTQIELAFHYGLTDKLTVGIMVPYWWINNDVSAHLDTSNATVGKSAMLNSLAPLPAPGTAGTIAVPGVPVPVPVEPLTTEDVQNLIGGGLDINGDGTVDLAGFGFERVEDWSSDGFSDIEVGCRYQYLKTEDWRLAFTGGVRLPTGEVKYPDSLVDYGFGSDAYTLLFRFNQDYIGIKNLLLNATFRYDLILPDKETKRVQQDVNRPLVSAAFKEEVDRNLGDVIELEASGRYQLSETFSCGLLYQYGFKFKDDISGDRGLAYESLEEETNSTEHVFKAGLFYSTTPLFAAKRFPVPLDAYILYRNRFAGSNNVWKSQYIGFGISVYF